MNNELCDLGLDLMLEILTASDSKVRANMMRYAKALGPVLTGHEDYHPRQKILIAMGFGMSDETDEAYQEATRRDGCDRLYLRFGVNEALGPPDGMGVVRLKGDKTVLYGRCNLWMAQTGGHPIIFFVHEGRYGHFSYRPGTTLKRIDSLPADDHRPGFRRAQDHLTALVTSKPLKKVSKPNIAMRMAEPKEQ